MTASPLFKQFESGENLFFKAASIRYPGRWHPSACVHRNTGPHVAPADRPRHPHRCARRLARPQLELLPRHAHASSGLYVLHLPLRLLENCDHREFFSRSGLGSWFSRRFLHHHPPLRRNLRLRHSVPRLSPDALAAAPHTRASARRSRTMARDRSPHSDLQRAP